MKTLFKITFALLLSISLLSCSNEEGLGDLDNLEQKTLTFDELFDKISNTDIDMKSEKILYIDYVWNKTNNSVMVSKVRQQEPDFFILETTESQNILFKKDKYTVECDRGGDGSDNWSETCDGKFSCGGLIADCLDEGGCATMCTNRMAYAPQTKTFYLLSN